MGKLVELINNKTEKYNEYNQIEIEVVKMNGETFAIDITDAIEIEDGTEYINIRELKSIIFNAIFFTCMDNNNGIDVRSDYEKYHRRCTDIIIDDEILDECIKDPKIISIGDDTVITVIVNANKYDDFMSRGGLDNFGW